MTTYDIVIVGAGSSGCAIAARASEDPDRTVLLVEAGPDYSDLKQTPFDLVNSHNNSVRAHDWALQYHPTRNQNVEFPRGRVVGGSSAVNTAIALRGMPEDYDEWAAAGNPDWAWERVLPAFKRLERDLDYGTAPYHGDAGPITIRRYPDKDLLRQHQAFLASARELGYPDCPDANDPLSFGAGPQPMNKLGRLRISCAVGYLAPARIRPNLTIVPDTLTRRVLIDGDRCVGIEVEALDGAIERIDARLVVLCGGSIMSPAILMRSGIGPRDHLESLGIEVRRSVAGVGQNLSDHPALSVQCRVKDGALVDHDAPIIQTILRYTAEGSDRRNDLQIEQLSFTGGRRDAPTFGVAAVLEYQYGRGELRLNSADPHEHPVIDLRFCEDDRDTKRLVGCFRDALAFTRTAPLADLIEQVTFPRPGAELDDATIAGLCRRRAGSGYHPSGTVKMGPASDASAVVDQHGCCHALAQLVVADASIMPAVPRANTNLTSIMIGEMVGEWLRTRPGLFGL